MAFNLDRYQVSMWVRVSRPEVRNSRCLLVPAEKSADGAVLVFVPSLDHGPRGLAAHAARPGCSLRISNAVRQGLDSGSSDRSNSLRARNEIS
jgi:hypothetical protein